MNKYIQKYKNFIFIYEKLHNTIRTENFVCETVS